MAEEEKVFFGVRVLEDPTGSVILGEYEVYHDCGGHIEVKGEELIVLECTECDFVFCAVDLAEYSRIQRLTSYVARTGVARAIEVERSKGRKIALNAIPLGGEAHAFEDDFMKFLAEPE